MASMVVLAYMNKHDHALTQARESLEHYMERDVHDGTHLAGPERAWPARLMGHTFFPWLYTWRGDVK